MCIAECLHRGKRNWQTRRYPEETSSKRSESLRGSSASHGHSNKFTDTDRWADEKNGRERRLCNALSFIRHVWRYKHARLFPCSFLLPWNRSHWCTRVSFYEDPLRVTSDTDLRVDLRREREKLNTNFCECGSLCCIDFWHCRSILYTEKNRLIVWSNNKMIW